MKETYQCEVCKNYHDTPEQANECEKSHLLPIGVLASKYDNNCQAPTYVQVTFDNKQGGEYAATYKFTCWRDPEEVISGDFQENVDKLVSAQLRKENLLLQLQLSGKERLIEAFKKKTQQLEKELEAFKKEEIEEAFLESTAFKMFKEALSNALSEYSEDNIDFVYDEELNEYCIKYHSDCDSFLIYGEAFEEFREKVDIESILIPLADELGVGHCF